MRTGILARNAAVAAAALLVLTACGGGGDDGGGGGTEAGGGGGGERQVNVYGPDGHMGNALANAFSDPPGGLDGMKGTPPLTQLSSDFPHRLGPTFPNLQDYNHPDRENVVLGKRVKL